MIGALAPLRHGKRWTLPRSWRVAALPTRIAVQAGNLSTGVQADNAPGRHSAGGHGVHHGPAAGKRLQQYIDGVGEILGHPKRKEAFASYTLGLLSDLERKSVEPIAALTCPDPGRLGAAHQSLLHSPTAGPRGARSARASAALLRRCTLPWRLTRGATKNDLAREPSLQNLIYCPAPLF